MLECRMNDIHDMVYSLLDFLTSEYVFIIFRAQTYKNKSDLPNVC